MTGPAIEHTDIGGDSIASPSVLPMAIAIVASGTPHSADSVLNVRNMRHISEIIIHCSATPEGRDVRPEEIRRWHLARGFSDIGYHFVVTLDGTIHLGRPLSKAGAHCVGHNAISVGVCYVGGCDSKMRPADTRTPEQSRALRALVVMLQHYFPGATVHGHREFAAKACPSFDISDL